MRRNDTRILHEKQPRRDELLRPRKRGCELQFITTTGSICLELIRPNMCQHIRTCCYVMLRRQLASIRLWNNIKIPFGDHTLYGYVRKPAAVVKPPIAVILPGLDAAKEELHSWSDAFLRRGLATLTLDGPGQGECIEALPITPEWGKVLGAVIDELERRSDIDAKRVGVVGQSSRRLVRAVVGSW